MNICNRSRKIINISEVNSRKSHDTLYTEEKIEKSDYYEKTV